MSSLKRKSLSIADKAVILQRLQNGEMNTMIAKEYGVAHTTISSIKKNKDRIESLLHTNDPKRKRVRTSTHKQIEQALLHWTKQQSDQGIPVNGPMLLEKANFFGTHLNIPDFKCSLSWVNRFKVRHNITGGKIGCESPVESAVSDFLTKVWPALRAQFTDEEIFNANQMELFYESEQKTLKLKLEKQDEGQPTKSRLTVMVATNMSGSVKKNLLVIGKSRGIPNLTVPLDYESNRRVWMTADIFTKWLRAWDDYLTKKKEKILLLVDNAPAHVPVSNLKSVVLVFLPLSLTSALKPHKGIIKALEATFQKNLALKIAGSRGTSDSITKSPYITLRDAVLMIYDAWNQLTPKTIRHCFKQAGFVQENEGYNSNSDFEDEDTPVIPCDHVVKIEFEDDENTVTSDGSSDHGMTHGIQIKTEIEDMSDDDLNVSKSDVLAGPSVSEALMAAELLSVFVNSNFQDDNLKGMMSRVHDAVRIVYYQTRDDQI